MTETVRRQPRRIGSRPAAPVPADGDPPVERADVPEPQAALDTEPDAAARKARSDAMTVEKLFVFCLAGGFIAAVVGILIGGEWGLRVTLFSPIVATFAYPAAGIALGFGARASVKERFADNCYYLGFIFTQGGLLLAFLPTTLGSRAITSGEVMQFFGMAIGAALIGLIARTVLIQTGVSVTDLSDTVQEEVELLAARVTAKARSVIDHLDRAADHMADIPERMAGRLEAQVGGVEQAMLRLGSALERTTAQLEQSGAAVREASQSTQEAGAQSVSSLGTATASVAAAIAALHEEIAQRTRDSTAAVGSACIAIAEATGGLSKVDGIGRELPRLHEEVGQLVAAGAELRRRLEALPREFEQAAVQAQREFTQSASGATAAFRQSAVLTSDEIARAREEEAVRVAARAETFQGEIERATGAFENVLHQFNDRLATVTKSVSSG
jgi:hypothetical protein